MIARGRAPGRRQEHRADIVVSGGDGMRPSLHVRGKYINDEIRAITKRCHLSADHQGFRLAWRATWQTFPPWSPTHLKPSHRGEKQERISMKHYGYDPTLAHRQSVVKSWLRPIDKYWRQLAETANVTRPKSQQSRLTVIEQLEKRPPGLPGRSKS